MDSTQLITVILACIGAPAFWDFLKFLFTPKSEKVTAEDFVSLKKVVEKINKDFAEFREEKEREKAEGARRRILRFDDELLLETEHSYEYFRNVLVDIDSYNKYVADHPNFRNGVCTHAIKHIEQIYDDCLRKNNFLTASKNIKK